MAERQGGAGSPAGRTAGCLLLPSRFRRAEPAASHRASNTVITCGGVHGAQWMRIDRQVESSPGSFLDIGAYYERQHVGGGLPTAQHAARASRGP